MTEPGGRATMAALAVAATLAVTLAGCTPPVEHPVATVPPRTTSPTPEVQVQPAGDPTVIASGLRAPWSVVPLENGSALISERDTAVVKELTSGGDVREVGTIQGVAPRGEGGLLGIAVLGDDEPGDDEPGDVESGDVEPGDEGLWLYAYLTSDSDNRIVRMPLDGQSGSYSLGEASLIVSGIEKAGNHNGGRIKFGPDGMLYATTGDAGNTALSQDPASLNGKILRMTPTGDAPDDNPTPDSLVYTFGHRNPQGLAWDSEGRLWASEFGQNTWDELNLIEAGNNYGWPEVEGSGGVEGFTDPVAQWSTAEASPSGLARVSNTFFMASLRGQTLWAIYPVDDRVDTVAWFAGEYGRLRDAVPGPDGSLWVLTNNTDGRGSPAADDDKLLQIRLTPLVEG